jgi:hypothetical protein
VLDLTASPPVTSYSFYVSNMPTLFLEGVAVSSAASDVCLTVAGDGLAGCPGQAYVTVFKLQVTNIKFNHATSSAAADALNIRQDYATAYNVLNGEWILGAQNVPACYTTNKSVTIKARVTAQPASVLSASIWAEVQHTNGSLKNLVKTTVAFTNGVSYVVAGTNVDNFVSFQMSGTTPSTVLRTTNDVWRWQAENINGLAAASGPMNTSGVHTVYTILGEPVAPWDNTWGPTVTSNAWVSALDLVCSNSPWAGGSTTIEEAATRVTRQIYNSGRFGYDTVSGDCNYTINAGNSGGYFDLSNWLARLNGGPGLGALVNCWDCANGVVALDNVLGCDLWNQWMGSGFLCNEIRAIQDGAWATPFTGGFSYHRVGWRGSVADFRCLPKG